VSNAVDGLADSRLGRGRQCNSTCLLDHIQVFCKTSELCCYARQVCVVAIAGERRYATPTVEAQGRVVSEEALAPFGKTDQKRAVCLKRIQKTDRGGTLAVGNEDNVIVEVLRKNGCLGFGCLRLPCGGVK
jgi:hypothetical protein